MEWNFNFFSSELFLVNKRRFYIQSGDLSGTLCSIVGSSTAGLILCIQISVYTFLNFNYGA